MAAAVHFSGGAVTASAAAVPGIETTQDIGTYFTGYGFDTDLASAAVDKVKIPKKWDDSFAAFNQIVQESGLDLADYKGKTVEKWTVLCPQLSTGDHDTYCVLLVYKAKAVGHIYCKAVRRGDRAYHCRQGRRRSRLGGNRGNFRRRLPGGVNAVDAARAGIARPRTRRRGGFHIRPRSFTSAAFYSSNHRSRGSANTAPQSSSRAGSLVRWVTWLSM